MKNSEPGTTSGEPVTKLVWHAQGQASHLTAEEHAGFRANPSESVEYLVHDYGTAWLVTFTDRATRDCDFPPFEIRSEAEAKAACERHFATGKWK